MGYKKILGVISVFVVAMFVLMLFSSYAWYSFTHGSTTFSAVTNNDDITVDYHTGMYISTNIAVPISSDEVDSYAEKSKFSIDVNNSDLENEIVVSVDLVDISIDSVLKNSNFKYELLLDGNSVSNGDFSDVDGSTFNLSKAVVLDSMNTNDFELRIYILDDGGNQNYMMNKSFKGTISINVISRLKTNIEQSGVDILINNITIDGEESNYIPTNGYYNMDAVCSKGSNLTWDPLKKVITYEKGSIVNDSCNLNFTSSINYPLLVDVAKGGDYVAYTGNNGCTGSACKGDNANYVSDIDMGYCVNSDYKFTVNGFRVGYIENGTAYLISAGATDCLCTNSDGKVGTNCGSYGNVSSDLLHSNNLDKEALKYCNSDYAYGGVCNSSSSWAIDAIDFQKITGNTLSSSSCYFKYSDVSCGYNNSLIDNGGYYWYATSSSSNYNFYWLPKDNRLVNVSTTNYAFGLRPVLRLASSVYVISGSGTYEDPYIIKNS